MTKKSKRDKEQKRQITWYSFLTHIIILIQLYLIFNSLECEESDGMTYHNMAHHNLTGLELTIAVEVAVAGSAV
jgi:hypothetical protein